MNKDINNNSESISFKYHFLFENGEEKLFEIDLDNLTLDYIQKPLDSYPQWAELEFQQCPNCTLTSEQHKYCPIAKNTIKITEFFDHMKSSEKITLRIVTEQRDYTKNTDLQSGVESLLGLIMVTSGCPVLDELRPMARFHLPFVSHNETVYRAVSMYLLGQFFEFKHNKTPDWKLENLNKIYDEINIINKAFLKRLNEVKTENKTLDAGIILDNLKKFKGFSIDEEALNHLETHFNAYLA